MYNGGMGISATTIRDVRNRLARHKDRRIGVAKKKVLLLLFGGISLGLSGSPGTYWKIAGAMKKEWEELSKQGAERAINSLYASRLVGAKENEDGTYSLTLNEKGRKRVLTYDLARMKIKIPPKWDNLWRMVSFDVPIGKKIVRDSIREHLLNLGFYEMQQSLFIHPFDCKEEIDYLVELHDARKHVRFFLVTHADNEPHLKKFFGME